jgi:hypothetical protein
MKRMKKALEIAVPAKGWPGTAMLERMSQELFKLSTYLN